MNPDVRKTIYSVGSLPFWTGEQKLVRLLAGEAGSYWEEESPLKPIYLNHYFFGVFEDRSSSWIRKMLNQLKSATVLKKSPISPDKPYKVIKLTSQGVKSYYNSLVLDRGHSNPHWWLHHISQLDTPPKSPITTGGELFEFSGELFLTQTPPHQDWDERVKEEKTVKFKTNQPPDIPGHYLLSNIRVACSEGVHLNTTEDCQIKEVPASDVKRELTHFPTKSDHLSNEDPFTIKGRLSDVKPTEDNRSLLLQLRNDDGAELGIITPRNSVDDQKLEQENRYVIGPVKETDQDIAGDLFVVELQQEGEVQPVRF